MAEHMGKPQMWQKLYGIKNGIWGCGRYNDTLLVCIIGAVADELVMAVLEDVGEQNTDSCGYCTCWIVGGMGRFRTRASVAEFEESIHP
eukprot:9612467-Ditylum_brightwellii.AAC.1